MTLPRMAVLAAVAISILMWAGCGDTFRPVATPISGPGGDPSSLRLALVVNQGVTLPSSGNCFDGGAPPCDGATMQINVSGDTNVGNYMIGRTPVQAFLSTSLSQALIANFDDDSITEYFPLPSSTPPGSPTVRVGLPAGTKPVYVVSATFTPSGGATTTTVYAAGFGNDTVPVINASNQLITTVNIAAAGGHHPVALATSTNGSRLFVVNRDSNNVTVIATQDNTVVGTVNVDAAPVYAVANTNGSAIYVLNSGSGTVSVINPTTLAVTSLPLPAAGGTFMTFDPSLQRLYVANPNAASVSVFDTTANPPTLLKTVAVPVSPSTPSGSVAAAQTVAATPDGSRLYVLNAAAGCSGQGNTSSVSLISTSNNTVTGCVNLPPGAVSVATSFDNARLYVPHQGTVTDGGGTVTVHPGVTIVNTQTNQVVTDLPAPFTDPKCTADSTDCVRMKPITVLTSH